MKYWKQGFYDETTEGAVELTDERWQELLDGQAAGQVILEDEQGRPVLADPPAAAPAATPSYEERVQTLIRERYTVADELALLRQRDTKPEEFAAYFEYAEQCKAKAKMQTEI